MINPLTDLESLSRDRDRNRERTQSEIDFWEEKLKTAIAPVIKRHAIAKLEVAKELATAMEKFDTNLIEWARQRIAWDALNPDLQRIYEHSYQVFDLESKRQAVQGSARIQQLLQRSDEIDSRFQSKSMD